MDNTDILPGRVAGLKIFSKHAQLGLSSPSCACRFITEIQAKELPLQLTTIPAPLSLSAGLKCIVLSD